MKDFDWKSTLATVAPAIAGMFGSPIAGLAVKAGLTAFGITGSDQPTNQQDAERLLASKVENATPEDMLKLKQANQSFTVKMEELDISRDKLVIDDTKDARHQNSDNNRVFWLGISVLITFSVVISGSMYGAWELLSGSSNVTKGLPEGLLAAIFSFIGTIIGYVAANAQQVISFFFGSSRGSKHKTDAMAAAFKGLKN